MYNARGNRAINIQTWGAVSVQKKNKNKKRCTRNQKRFEGGEIRDGLPHKNKNSSKNQSCAIVDAVAIVDVVCAGDTYKKSHISKRKIINKKKGLQLM